VKNLLNSIIVKKAYRIYFVHLTWKKRVNRIYLYKTKTKLFKHNISVIFSMFLFVLQFLLVPEKFCLLPHVMPTSHLWMKMAAGIEIRTSIRTGE